MVPLVLLAGVAILAAGIGKKLLLAFQLPLAGGLEEFVFFSALGLGGLSYLVFGLGIAGLLYRPWIWIALLLAAVFCRREIYSFLLRWRPPHRLSLPHWSRWTYLLLILIGLAITLNLLGTLAPVSSADALAYHLEAPRYYLQHHRIVEMPWEWRTYQPFNVEMLFLTGMLLGSDILGVLIHWFLGVLILAAIAAFCRRHAPGVPPLLAASIFYVSGLVAWESTSGFIELGVALFGFLSFFAFWNWLADGRRAWLILSGLFGGLAAGSKLSGAVLPAILAMILLGWLVYHGRFAWKTVAAFALPVLALAAPWYLRNYVWTGNPVFPFLPGVFGTRDSGALLQWASEGYGYGKDLGALLLAPFRVTFQGAAFDKGELVGPLYLSLFPLAIVLAPEKRFVRLSVFFISAYFLVWFFTSQQARFLLPILPLMAVGAGSAATRLLASNRVLRMATVSALTVGLGLGLGIVGFYNTQFLPVVFGLESRDKFLSRKTWYYSEIQWMNANLPPGARVLMTDGTPYYLERDYEMGSLEGGTAPTGFDYVFCTGDCLDRLPPGSQTVHESTATLIGSRTLPTASRQVHTFVVRLLAPQTGRSACSPQIAPGFLCGIASGMNGIFLLPDGTSEKDSGPIGKPTCWGREVYSMPAAA